MVYRAKKEWQQNSNANSDAIKGSAIKKPLSLRVLGDYITFVLRQLLVLKFYLKKDLHKKYKNSHNDHSECRLQYIISRMHT